MLCLVYISCVGADVISVTVLYIEDEREKGSVTPCAGGVEYFHRSPASHKRL
jgi:hypothetical protein